MSASIDALAVCYAILGAIFMGSYPMAVKAPAVLEARVHPAVFQAYKSFWVFVAGWCFVLANAIRGQEVVFAFTWWGVVGAAFWVPCGICIIAAVPRLGVALDQAVNPGVSAVLNFLVGVFVVGQHVRKHGSGDSTFVVAPWYIVGVVASLVGMVAAIHACKRRAASDGVRADEELANEDSSADVKDASRTGSGWTLLIGLVLSFCGGLFSTLQFAALSFGKRAARAAHGGACADSLSACPPVLQEQFNNTGSWMASFGIGAAAVSAAYFLGACAVEAARGRPAPRLHFGVMSRWGSVAGLLWAAGYFFQQAAVVRAGGPAFMQPLNLALQTITSGAWGVLYYREVRSPRRLGLWTMAVSLTITFAILLNSEKGA